VVAVLLTFVMGLDLPYYTQRRSPRRSCPSPAGATQWTTSEQAAASAQPSILDQLTQLGDLKGGGVLTDAEFEAQKARILAG
jgi:hypothetical protein